MCTTTGGHSDLPEFTLKRPTEYRIAETLSDFFKWLSTNKNLPTEHEVEIVDTSNMSDGEFARYYNEYITTILKRRNNKS